MLFIPPLNINLDKILEDNLFIKKYNTEFTVVSLPTAMLVHSDVTTVYLDNGTEFECDTLIEDQINCEYKKTFTVKLCHYTINDSHFAEEVDELKEKNVNNLERQTTEHLFKFTFVDSFLDFFIANISQGNKRIGHLFISEDQKTYNKITEMLNDVTVTKIEKKEIETKQNIKSLIIEGIRNYR